MGPDRARRVLGVSERDDAAAVRSAFRRLVLLAHPDRNRSGDAALRTAELTIAYRTLTELDASTTPATSATSAASAPRHDAGDADDGQHGRHGRPDDVAAVQVSLLDGETIAVHAPAEETLLLLVEAAHELGEISYLDPSAGLVEVIVEFVEAPTSSVLLTMQGRATGHTEVFCTVEPLSGGPAPPGDAVTRLIAHTLGAVADQRTSDTPRPGSAQHSETSR